MEYILNKIDLNSRDKIQKITRADKVRSKSKIKGIKKYKEDEKKNKNRKFSLNQKKSENVKIVVTAKKETTIEVEGFKEDSKNNNDLGRFLDIRK
ncbi:hypothetical protein [Clostridium hydrogenum]|uniref:hypothetical protein n=1 Tax=Clostridium hydrogenum TaxID=2855764 RepID=UPI001F3ADD38|nr:hypothetical protein [Clostridium hydrogenum]